MGGAETTAFRLAGALRKNGIDLQVIALRNEGQMKPFYQQAGIPLLAGLQKFRFDILGLFRVWRALRRHKTETMIVVDAFHNAMFFGLSGAKLSGLPIRKILWSNSTPTGQLGDFTARLRNYISQGLLDEIVLTSAWQQEHFVSRSVPEDKISLIYNGVDIEKFASPDIVPAELPPITMGRAVAVQVANVVPDKDFETLLTACKILARRENPPCVLLVGRGTDSPEMSRRIEKLGLDDVVIPLGQRNDVPEILAAADLFVLSTRSEVFNVAVLEAMAAGLPVVVSDIPAFEEMFKNGMQGLKVFAGNPGALAEGIGQLVDDADLRNRFIVAGKAHVQQFSCERMTQKFLELLRL
jgi:glycosyltransferase involved in cell wall biosynthesis